MSVPPIKHVDIGDGRTISYREAGSGTPLVFLHGLGGRSESWTTQYDTFAVRYRVIGWDAPGYGESTQPDSDDPGIAYYVDAAKKFVDALGLEKFHLVGHSVGTVIAASFHRQFGDRLLSLVLAEAVAGSGKEPADKRNAAAEGRIKELDEMGPAGFAKARTPNSLSPRASVELVSKAVEFASRMNVEGYKKLFRGLIGCDMYAEAAPLTVPAMIIEGSDDKSAPPEVVRAIAKAFPGIRHERIPGIGHQIALEHPRRFNLLLDQFLNAAAKQAA
jgi:pimeloyl-ACP methyl ester carboxylesterase